MPTHPDDSVDARRALFEREAPRVWSLVYRMTGDYDLSHDVTQDTFIRAFSKLDQFEGRGSLSAWLARIAVNLTRGNLRTSRRRMRFHLPLDAAGGIADAPAPDDEQDGPIQRAVAQLPEQYRLVLVMHDLEGYSHAEIGTILGIETSSSRARLSRARRMVRLSLTDCGGLG